MHPTNTGKGLPTIIASVIVTDATNGQVKALLDGATVTRLLFTLVLPMSRSSITTVGVYTAIGAWNGLLFPLILTQSDSQRVLTLGLWKFQGQFGTDFPALLATGAVADERVAFYEPLKFVAKARALTTGDRPIMARIAMAAGHAGDSGASAVRSQEARLLTFAIWAADNRWGGVPQRPPAG